MEGRSRSILIDSNIVIYAALPENEVLRTWLKKNKIFVSEISMLEVLGYHKLTKGDIIYFEEFFSASRVLAINSKQIQKAVELRQNKSMSLGDSIIAATALKENLPLVTANTKDFRHIPALELIDPFRIQQ